MSKSYPVKSKYKNPDKYIDKLKNELKLKEDDINYWVDEYNSTLDELTDLKEKQFGHYWFSYNNDVTHSVAFVNNPLENSKLGSVGDQVVIIGDVIEVTQSNKKDVASAIFHTHTVYLKKKKSNEE